MEVLSISFIRQIRDERWSKFFLLGLGPVNVSEKPVAFDVLQGGADVGVCNENCIEQVFLELVQ